MNSNKLKLKESNRLITERSGRPEEFCKKGRPATLFKKRLWQRCYPVNFVKFLRTPFFIEHLWWLLLYRGKRVNHWNEYFFRKHNREFRSKEGWWLSLNPINSENINDILEKHKNHPSVQEISQTFMTNKNFLLNSWRKI